jgi:hypothetical protein
MLAMSGGHESSAQHILAAVQSKENDELEI